MVYKVLPKANNITISDRYYQNEKKKKLKKKKTFLALYNIKNQNYSPVYIGDTLRPLVIILMKLYGTIIQVEYHENKIKILKQF